MCRSKSRRASCNDKIVESCRKFELLAFHVRIPEILLQHCHVVSNRKTANAYPCLAAVIKAPSTRATGIEAERRSFSGGPSRCIMAARNERFLRNAYVPYQFAQAVTRATYGVRQLPRVAWYIGHSLVLRELADTVRQSEKSRRDVAYTPMRQCQTENASNADMAKLFLRDLANVEAGIYPAPADHDGSLLALVRRSRMFFDDLPNIHRRRKRYAHYEVLNDTNSRDSTSLLPAELPLSVGWLDDRQFGRAVRHSGRSSF